MWVGRLIRRLRRWGPMVELSTLWTRWQWRRWKRRDDRRALWVNIRNRPPRDDID